MKGFLKFIYNNRIAIAVTAVLSAAVRFAMLACFKPGIDTVSYIYNPDGYYEPWNMVGRFGLTFLSRCMGRNFNLYVTGIVTVILLVFAAVVSAYVCAYALQDDEPGFAAFALPALLFTLHPIMTEQLYFALQSIEVCLAYIFISVSVLIVAHQADKETGKPYMYIPAVLLFAFGVSIYQAFCEVFIFETAAVLLFASLKRNGKLKDTIPYISVFAVGFALYLITAKIVSGGSSYYGGEVRWGKYPVKDNLIGLAGAVIKSLTGYNDPHYSFTYGLLVVCALILLAVYTKDRKEGRVMTWLYMCAMLICPYLLAAVSGGYSPIRTKLSLPVSVAFVACLCIYLAGRSADKVKKSATVIAAVICVSGILAESYVTLGMYRAADMCYEKETALAKEIAADIDEVMQGDDLPVLFVGKKEISSEVGGIKGETIGYSHFEWDTDVPPKYYRSTERIIALMHLTGHEYKMIEDLSLLNDLDARTASYPSWPEEGSVVKEDKVILVKLSD